MRTWTINHPNAMVAWWVFLWAAELATNVAAVHVKTWDRYGVDWWIMTALGGMCLIRVATWWKRT